MPSLPASVETMIWNSPRHEVGPDLVADRRGCRDPSTAGAEPVALEPLDDPVGGVGVLGEHHGLLVVAGQIPFAAKAVVDQRLPLRYGRVVARQRAARAG